jgi:pimeloyl-ACP methyl ester carboxylesterase
MPSLERDGARIAYASDGSGDAVLLCQGAGVAGSGWKPQVEALRDRWRCVTFDNRGFGGSTSGPRRADVEDLAGDALAVLDALGIERAHVVGHSMGGLVAQAIALAAQSRVRTLSLLCTFDRGGRASLPSVSVMWTGLWARIGSAGARRRTFLELVVPPAELAAADRDVLAAELGALFGRDLAEQPPGIYDQIRAMSRFDRRTELATLGSIPTLVVSGELDRIATPAAGRALAALIPGARYEELAGAGHALTVHGPNVERVNQLLRAHLAARPADV